ASATVLRCKGQALSWMGCLARDRQAEARRPKPSLSSAPRLAAGGCGRGFGPGGGGWLLLAFHLRQALLECRHQVYHGSEFLGLLDGGHFSAFELGFDQLLQVLLEGVFVLLGIPLVCQRFNQLVR